MLTLETNNNKKDFGPGATIEGRFSWRMPDTPKRAALRLIWYTEGKGTQDVEIVDEIEFAAPQASHDDTFRFTLPDAPYSFSGKLISLKWALELVINRGEHVERRELLVSPWVTEVKLVADRAT